MKKNILYTLLLSINALFFLNACGTDSKANSADIPLSDKGITASITCFYDPTAKDGPIKYELHCYVHTVDANSNPINGLTYEVSVITDVKASSFNKGTILTTDPITFSDDSQTFIKSSVNKTDTLIILPNDTKNDISYLGNWQVTSVNSNNNLTLKESAFNLETTEELSYVVGNETTYVNGSSGSAHIIYSGEGNTTLNTSTDDGLFYFTLVFDAQLVNRLVYLGAHTGKNRIGAATARVLSVEDNTTTP